MLATRCEEIRVCVGTLTSGVAHPLATGCDGSAIGRAQRAYFDGRL